MKILFSFLLLINLSLPSSNLSGDAECLKNKYKGTWKNNSIYITISDASFNNFLAYSGKLSGFTQFKNNICPLSGTFKLIDKGTYSVSMGETGSEKYCNAWFYGSFICYSDRTEFYGEIETSGEYAPKREELNMTSKY